VILQKGGDFLLSVVFALKD